MRYAVIDLGTNTFHLLLADRGAQGPWQPVMRQKVYVKLAEEGIQRIGDAAFERGLQALRSFKMNLDEAGMRTSAAKALGTAALRTADNAADFIRMAFEQTGIRIELISGNREAELIYKGVRRAVPFPDHRVLIMDIGGGSVEFIIADREQVYWQQSFPIGVAVLFRNFHKHDPIAKTDIETMERFLETDLSDLWRTLAAFSATSLVGASGTFDVIEHFLLDPHAKPALYGQIQKSDFDPLYHHLIGSTLQQRRSMPKLPPERVDMVVVALILIQYVLRRAGISGIYTSAYAMKEGMLEELFSGNDL